ncbi:MAG: hypothetical protein U0U67_12170 [Chitinophagales bacterium]
MKKDYLPNRDAELDTWELNFITKLPAIATALGIPTADVTKVTATINQHRITYNTTVAKKNEAIAATNTNTLKKKETKDSIRKLAKQLKANNLFTEAIGRELDILTKEVTFPANEKPTLTATIDAHHVVLKYVKHTHQGIIIYTKRGDETEFENLGFCTKTKFIDTRANIDVSKPEERQYKAIYIADDVPTGIESDVVSITVI